MTDKEKETKREPALRRQEKRQRQLLSGEALQRRLEAAERAQGLRQAIAEEHGVVSDSAMLIREDRDARG